jgi:hypothetical protein
MKKQRILSKEYQKFKVSMKFVQSSANGKQKLKLKETGVKIKN